MKTIRRLFLPATALLIFAAGPLRAGDQPVAPAQPPVAAKDMAAVEQFLKLSDAELGQMALVIERLRAMKPAERAALRQEIAKFRQLPELQREQLRMGWGWMPREMQDGWREMMQGAAPEKRAEIQAKMQTLTPDEKTAYRQQLVAEYLKARAAKK